MNRVQKIMGGLVLLCALLLYVVINHSEFTQELTCKGSLIGVTDTQEEIAHIQLTEYRRWVHLWADSDGNVTVQLEKASLVQYMSYVEKAFDGNLALYTFRNRKGETMRGGYRVANSELTVRFSDNLTFVGTSCSPR